MLDFTITRPRPVCKCGKIGPTINGRCPEHMDIETEGQLMTVSAEDVLAEAQNEGLPGR
jgi:hypothetical protein